MIVIFSYRYKATTAVCVFVFISQAEFRPKAKLKFWKRSDLEGF
jgi:hypothetical protein